jgi:hypothetical protein
MIDRQALLTDLQKLLQRLEADLLQRSESDEVPEVGRRLREEYERAKKAQRTAQNYEDWRSDTITQAAAAWVLSCVFVRFLEDNRLIDPPKIAGPGKRLQQARDEWELYLGAAKRPNERDYLLSVFDELAGLPGTKEVFGPHNPIRELPNWLSGDGARDMLAFFQKIDANSAESNKLVHDFTDPAWETRFLGDLYQDLSEAARKKYALLQTPEFVEEFILDRTLEPALNEFGLDGFRMIDPACGSGHFLLGSFPRILGRWQKKEPGAKVRDLVQRTLDSIHGVDVNPYAVAIARFRLLLVVMRAEGIKRLADAPAFRFNLACGDSLLHGSTGGDQQLMPFHELAHVYQNEDLAELRRILRPGQYHAVVGNPPYITPKDKALNDAYRERYSTCYRQYSLAVPFMQRLFHLAQKESLDKQRSGFVGQITANSFMKREFGKKLIEEFLPTVDLTHVIDSQLAHIPGHGIPTVILLGRHRPPVAPAIRLVGAIKREDEEPVDAAKGLVWCAIVGQIDHPGTQSEFVSVADTPRESLHKHPWSIGGGGAAELKGVLAEAAVTTLKHVVDEIGFLIITGEDSCLVSQMNVLRRGRVRNARKLVIGDHIRDWCFRTCQVAVWPNNSLGDRLAEAELPALLKYLWTFRTILKNRKVFGEPIEQKGLPWWAIREVYARRLTTRPSIAFPLVATHNHFAVDFTGITLFNASSPVIKLPADANRSEHFKLLGLLNSSSAAFWFRQTCHDKGGGGIGGGIAAESWERFHEYSATKPLEFPVPAKLPLSLPQSIHEMTESLHGSQLSSLSETGVPTRRTLELKRKCADDALSKVISLQEELDWECYSYYRLLEDNLTYTGLLPQIQLGQRAFEIVMARRMADGKLQTTWFDRHGSTPTTELPRDWPEDYKRLVERRIELIETDRDIALIEQPEYKRRWNTEPWESQLERALREWLLGRLESYFDFDGRMNDEGKPTSKTGIALTGIAYLADIARQDSDFMQVGELYRNDPAFDVERLVVELVEAESVPLLSVLRYKPSGLRKRAEWEQTWELQREEDRTDKRLDIPVPPKYTSADFLKSDYWRLRGKLDVPKERWISFPHCEGPDGTLVIAWAGYDHLQLARAVSAYYVDIQEHLGGRDDPRLVPLLACLLELLPWIKQWHNDPDAAFDGMRMGDYFEGFIQEEARQLGKTIPEIKAWQPPQRTGRGKKK